jgi:uncharacterized protein (DUF2141 family)
MSFVVFISLFFTSKIYTQTADLTVKVTEIKELKGQVMIALFNSKETYFNYDEITDGVEIPIDSSTVSHTFKNLPLGTYAVTIYQDVDSNGEMNRSFIGFPKEPYAFSNNFHSMIRPASFKDASFLLENDTTIEIEMVY